MELYTHSKLSIVQLERLELLKNPQLVKFEEFSQKTSDPFFFSLRLFKREALRYWSAQSLNFQPDGFALSSAQPSGVLGQGTNLDGKYYEIECSECDSESCLNCALVKCVSV